MGNKPVPCDRISIDFTTKRIGIFYPITIKFSDFSNLKDVCKKVKKYDSYKELTLYCNRYDTPMQYVTNKEIMNAFVTKCNIDNLVIMFCYFSNRDLLALTNVSPTIIRTGILNIRINDTIISDSNEFGMNLANFLSIIHGKISLDNIKNFSLKMHISAAHYETISGHLLGLYDCLNDNIIVTVGRQKNRPQIYVLTCEYMRNAKYDACKFIVDLS